MFLTANECLAVELPIWMPVQVPFCTSAAAVCVVMWWCKGDVDDHQAFFFLEFVQPRLV